MNEPEQRLEFKRKVPGLGLAQVWEGFDLVLQRRVMVKKIDPQFAQDPELRPRFEREARAAARLSHPNVVQIHDLQPVGDELWLVFEWVDGKDVRALLKEHGRFPPRVAATIAGEILSGLDRAHAMGVLHRDLKPANVMVSNSGEVKITDFGTATLKDQPALALTQQGLTGQGTLEYWAPEQYSGEVVTEATDLFATGLVLFEMLTGRPVHEGQTAHQLLENVQRYKPPRLDAYGDAVPSEIRPVLARLLQKSPSDRYATAQEAREALRAAVDGFYSPVLIADTLFGTVEHKPAIRPSAKVSRRRWLVPLLGFLAVALVAIVAVLLLSRGGDSGSSNGKDSLKVVASQDTTLDTVQTATEDSSGLRDSVQESPPPPPPIPDTAWVRLRCEQAAVALIDSNRSVAVGPSDTLLVLGPPYGRRELTFVRSEIGFDVRVPFEIARGDTSELRVNLYDHVAYLNLWCKQEANVSIAGMRTQHVGQLNPVVGVMLPVGEAHLSFVSPDIDFPVQLKVSLAAAETTRVRVNLDTLVARFWVNTVRPWPAVEVYLDGRYRDATPMGKPVYISPGEHTVVLRNQKQKRDSLVYKKTFFSAGDSVWVEEDLTARQ